MIQTNQMQNCASHKHQSNKKATSWTYSSIADYRYSGYQICSQCIQNGKAVSFIKQYHKLIEQSRSQSVVNSMKQTIHKLQNRKIHECLEFGEGLLIFFTKYTAECMKNYITFIENITSKQTELVKYATKSTTTLQKKVQAILTDIIFNEVKSLTSIFELQFQNNENKIRNAQKYLNNTKNEMKELLFSVNPIQKNEEQVQNDKREDQMNKSINFETVFNQEQANKIISIVEANIQKFKKKSQDLQYLIKEGKNIGQLQKLILQSKE